MMTLGSLVFAAPAALAALVLLPLLWWLLRITPPSPRKIMFPPVRFLLQLASREESAAKTPLWLVMLRVALVVALIGGAAHPMLNLTGMPGTGPIVIVVDDGWSSAKAWASRQTALNGILDTAAATTRSVLIVLTARRDPAEPRPGLELMTAPAARGMIKGLQPKPWGLDRGAALQDLSNAANGIDMTDAAIVWLSDGLSEAPAAGGQFVRRLSEFGPVTAVLPHAHELPVLLRPDTSAPMTQNFVVDRPSPHVDKLQTIRVWADNGQPLLRQDVVLADGSARTAVHLEVPAQLRSRMARIDLAGENHPAAVFLVDSRWHRRPVGVVANPAQPNDHPYLSGQYYLEKALAPTVEVHKGTIDALLHRPLAVLAFVDEGQLAPGVTEQVLNWVREGGILLQFAGPRLAASHDLDYSLLPVRLRRGDRVIGGSMSWETPSGLAPFEQPGVFAELAIPNDVEVRRQVLTEPSHAAAAMTWARLTDGTPVVSARQEGSGWLVLFHTTASAEWSNLALSGLFVEMLQRIVDLSHGVGLRTTGAPLDPVSTLDGFGEMQSPPRSARPIAAEAITSIQPGPHHPPGFYGTQTAKSALNFSASAPSLRALEPFEADVIVHHYADRAVVDLRPWLLAAALVLSLLDLAITLIMRGLLPAPRQILSKGAVSGVIIVIILTASPSAVFAQMVVEDGPVPPQALKARLAYVSTGDARDDAIVRAGLFGLTAFVNRRTAVELAEPVSVDLAADELVFYPFIYWSLTGHIDQLPEDAIAQLKAYMRGGGTILLDARRRDASDATAKLRSLARRLELPALIPVPDDHIVRRAYYLLAELPGRWTGQSVWVERSRPDVHDGVSSIVAGSHDWAGAWAMDEATRAPLLPVVPGGERQREMAYRFGLNLVMYVLTGSYKADQVHLPAILERLER